MKYFEQPHLKTVFQGINKNTRLTLSQVQPLLSFNKYNNLSRGNKSEEESQFQYDAQPEVQDSLCGKINAFINCQFTFNIGVSPNQTQEPIWDNENQISYVEADSMYGSETSVEPNLAAETHVSSFKKYIDTNLDIFNDPICSPDSSVYDFAHKERTETSRLNIYLMKRQIIKKAHPIRKKNICEKENKFHLNNFFDRTKNLKLYWGNKESKPPSVFRKRELKRCCLTNQTILLETIDYSNREISSESDLGRIARNKP